MKLAKRDIGLLLGLLGALALFMVFRFVYEPTMEQIEKQNKVLNERTSVETKLVDLDKNMAHYQDEMKKMDEDSREIVTHFPAGLLPENEIMYAVELEKHAEIYFGSLSYGSAAAVTTGKEDKTSVSAYRIPLGLSYQATYQGLKDAILYNNAQNDRRVLDSVTATFDSTTGNLSGSLTLMQYYMTGTENVYQAPFVPSMSIGRDNIFGTVELPENEEAAD